MELLGREIHTIEEAFACLTEDQQAHGVRVGAYAKAVFLKAVAADVYSEQNRARQELQAEYADFVELGGRYHDVGHLLPDETEVSYDENGQPLPLKEHSAHGVELVTELYPGIRKLCGYERRLMLDGIRDHCERMDGSGYPLGKEGQAISYAGRIVAIANELDKRAVVRRSEDPIGDVLRELKEEVAAGKLDGEFYKTFNLCRDKLRRIFDKDRSSTAAVPPPEAWITRRTGRPAELRYRKLREVESGETIWLADMFFRLSEKQYVPYDQVKHVIAQRKLDVTLGDYFLYELCDTVRRFGHCGIPCDEAIVQLPAGWYKQKKLSSRIEAILKDEQLPPGAIGLLIPPELENKPPKQFVQNMAECEMASLRMEWRQTLFSRAPLEDAPYLLENDIVRAALGGEDAAAEAPQHGGAPAEEVDS